MCVSNKLLYKNQLALCQICNWYNGHTVYPLLIMYYVHSVLKLFGRELIIKVVVVFVHFGKYNRRKVSKEDHICLSCVGVKIVNLDINIVMLLLYTLYLNCLKTRNKYHCFVHIVESVLFIIVSRNWSLFFFLTRLDVKASKENAYALLLKSSGKLSLKYLYNFFID